MKIAEFKTKNIKYNDVSDLRLTKSQSNAIEHLLKGMHVHVEKSLLKMTQKQWIANDDNSERLKITERVADSLRRRMFVDVKKFTYKEREILKMTLKPEIANRLKNK